MKRMMKHAALAVAAVMGAATFGVAHAATVEIPVGGLKLILLDKYGLGKAKAVFVSKDPNVDKGDGVADPKNDPPNIDATVEIFPTGDPSNVGVWSLPDPWLVNKATVAKYVNKAAAPGGLGAKVTVVKPGKVAKFVGKNLGDGDSASGDQGAGDLNLQALTTSDTMRVVVTINNGVDGNTYILCSDFTGLVVKNDKTTGDPFKVISKTSTAPANCGGYGSPSHAFMTKGGLLD